jgi:HNH endonuclease/NUMOD4 motif
MTNIQENWKPVRGTAKKYYVSDQGRLRSDRGILKGSYHTRYISHHIYKNGVDSQKLLHRLVAKAFIPNPENKPFVNHKDGNKLNNKAENLEWVTCYENTMHAFKNSLRYSPKGTSHGASVLNEIKVITIRKRHSFGESMASLAREFGVANQTIGHLVRRSTWKHI